MCLYYFNILKILKNKQNFYFNIMLIFWISKYIYFIGTLCLLSYLVLKLYFIYVYKYNMCYRLIFVDLSMKQLSLKGNHNVTIYHNYWKTPLIFDIFQISKKKEHYLKLYALSVSTYKTIYYRFWSANKKNRHFYPWHISSS